MAKGISIRSVRNVNYAAGKILGDVSALTRGDIFGRVVRRITGKGAGNVLRIFDTKT